MPDTGVLHQGARAPGRSVIEDVLAQHMEGASAVWIAREALARGPHARLVDLSRMDDRIDAYMDGIAVAGSAGLALVLQTLGQEADACFVACLAAVRMGDRAGLHQVLELTMTSASCDQEPAVGVQKSEQLTHFHPPTLGVACSSVNA